MRKTIIVTYLVIGLLSCMAFPMAHAQPSPYHYAQRSSYPFGCRDVASKKEVGKHHLLVQYRSTVNMSAEEGAKKYTPDYDIMNLEIRDSFFKVLQLLAETSFRGRRYKVWFTPDIPSSRGPWKFDGLSGLIMAAEDEDHFFLQPPLLSLAKPRFYSSLLRIFPNEILLVRFLSYRSPLKVVYFI